MGVLPAVILCHMFTAPPRGQKRVSATLELELQMAESNTEGAGNGPGPLKEEPVQLAAES